MATVSVEIEDAEMEATTNTTTTRFVRLIPNERKKVEQIRATSGPHVGQRVRLKVASLEDARTMEEEEEEEEEEDIVAKKAIVRTSSVLRFVVANGVQIESEIKPKLPDAFDGGESFSRQFGTMKQHGMALQVRFKPLGHFNDNKEEHGKKIEKLEIGKPNTLYEICDGAITIDKMSLAASITTSRVAEAAKPFANVGEETPRIGKSPEVWNFKTKNEKDEDYDRKKPNQIRADQRGQERCEEIAKEYEEETRYWMGTNNHVSGQIKVMQEIDKKVAALEGKLKAVTGFIVALEGMKEQGKNNDDDAIVATREMIEQAEEEIKILGHVSFEEGKTEEVDREDHDHNQAHKHEHRRKPFTSFTLSQLGVYVDECENQPISELKKILARTRDSLQLARQIQKCTVHDTRLRHNWDLYESNIETRDVLENGIRREDMERLLGREATKQDVEASLQIPLRERARIVGGASHIAAGDDRMLSGTENTNAGCVSKAATKALPPRYS